MSIANKIIACNCFLSEEYEREREKKASMANTINFPTTTDKRAEEKEEGKVYTPVRYAGAAPSFKLHMVSNGNIISSSLALEQKAKLVKSGKS